MLPGSHSDIRYHFFVKFLKKEYSENPLVLEVGSGPVGISHYWKGKVVGLDIDVQKKKSKNLLLVKGTAIQLPFRDKEFDCTIAIDFLEHIPQGCRKKAVLEMIRVTKKDIVVGVPCGDKAIEWENKARKVYEKKINEWKRENLIRASLVKQRGVFLIEHENMGLPSEQWLLKMVEEAAQESTGTFNIKVSDNESLWVWYFYLLAELKYNYFRWLATAALTMAIHPFLRKIKWAGCYRKIFTIRREK